MLNGVLGMGEEGKREIPNHEKLDKVGWISWRMYVETKKNRRRWVPPQKK